MPRNSVSLGFNASPAFGNAYGASSFWPSRSGPANDGSCNELVSKQVLEQVGISIAGTLPPRGRLCGLDLNNMDCRSALKLSLAENMAVGKVIEVYLNEYGQAYFQEVYPNPPTAVLDIRLCVPTSNINQQTDLVIVRGYDKPPLREFKAFYPVISKSAGSVNPSPSAVINSKQSYLSTAEYLGAKNCHGKLFATEATISYKDPVLETAYNDGIDNLYELKAFEDLIGYVIDFDGSSDPGVKYSFSDTTVIDVELNARPTRVSPESQFCGEAPPTSSIPLGSFEGTNIYGERWPLLLNVHNIMLVGWKIKSMTDLRAFHQLGYSTAQVSVELQSTNIELLNLPASTNWYWELGSSSGATIHLYYAAPDGDLVSELAAVSDSGADITVFGGAAAKGDPIVGQFIFPYVGGSIAFLVKKMLVNVEIDRPSVTVQEPNGFALDLAKQLSVRYQPIIVTDEPPPVAYTFGSGARLVDHTKDLTDSDPATQQTPPSLLEGSLAWLQTQTTGSTVDISLPFADEADCLKLADTIFDMQSEQMTSYKLVCGPKSKPQLGAKVAGFQGRINSIVYNYQDGSQYNINVDIGPTFQNTGGWGQTIWQRRTEDVSREAIICWSAGDGINYRVRIAGLGVYNAINKTLGCYAAGEKVSVTLHNNPVETL